MVIELFMMIIFCVLLAAYCLALDGTKWPLWLSLYSKVYLYQNVHASTVEPRLSEQLGPIRNSSVSVNK